jgi:hypothetical protein
MSMKDEDVSKSTEPKDEQEAERLKVKTNVKAGGDPDVPGFAGAVDPPLPGSGG